MFTSSREPPADAPDIYPMPSFASLDVRDLESSLGWYRDVLGFQVIISFPKMAHVRWIKFADLLLRPGDVAQEPGCGVTISFQATPERLRGLVLRQVGWMALVGLAVGLVSAVLIGRAAAALLFGLTGDDPTVLATAAIVLACVVAAAGYLPARRAARVAPMEALRYE